MYNNNDFPVGADNPDAPWYEKENKPVEVEVTVSITLSKTVKVNIVDYERIVEKDEDNIPFLTIDLSNCDLKKAVEEQIILPQDAYKSMLPRTKTRKDLSGWNVDDFEVVKED